MIDNSLWFFNRKVKTHSLITPLSSSPQCLSVPGSLSEPDGRLCRRTGAVRSPGADLRRRQRPLHHRHRGGLQCYRQVRQMQAPRLLCDLVFSSSSFLSYLLRISFLPFLQREAAGLPVVAEAAGWLVRDARWRGSGCQVRRHIVVYIISYGLDLGVIVLIEGW